MLSKDQIIEFLKSNKQYLKQQFGVERIGLFGSYAQSIQTEESDIDILVALSNQDFMQWSGLLNYLQHSLGKKVDLITDGKHTHQKFSKLIANQIIYA